MPIATIPFDPLLFGTAANNGQMVAEASAKTHHVGHFADVAQVVSGRKELKSAQARPRARACWTAAVAPKGEVEGQEGLADKGKERNVRQA